MDVAAAACLGVLAGILICLAVARARRPPKPAESDAAVVAQAGPPHEVVELLAALTSTGIVLDSADAVVAASPTAHPRGLLQDDEVAHPSLLALARTARTSGEPCQEQLWLPRGPQGARRLMSARAAPLGNEHVLLLVEDQSQAHYVEEVRRDFVTNVSHELKTPLGGLSLLAEAVRRAKDEPAAVNRFGKRMQKECRRLAEVVNDLVELSKLQSEDRLLDPKRVQLAEVVGRAAADVQVAAEEKGIRLAVRSDPGCWVWGDSHLLVTAVRNLVANAVAYSGPDTKVAVHARVRPDGGREIIVSDEGQGIPESEQARIFERFYRVDAARSRATGGTGLGLSIVKHVCTSHGGDVSVWSEVGHGSTFTVTLPAPSLGPGSGSGAQDPIEADGEFPAEPRVARVGEEVTDGVARVEVTELAPKALGPRPLDTKARAEKSAQTKASRKAVAKRGGNRRGRNRDRAAGDDVPGSQRAKPQHAESQPATPGPDATEDAAPAAREQAPADARAPGHPALPEPAPR